MSKRRRRRKLVLIGLDAWTPGVVERLLQRGLLPRVKGLMDRGSFGRLIPFWPCATGNNWCSIITGASPAVHGCDFNLWLPGHPLDCPQLGFPSTFCKAEQLWQTASREGLTTVIFDYPQSYPVNAERVIHVGEDGCPDNSRRELFMPWGYSTEKLTPRGAAVMSQVRLAEPKGWRNLEDASRFLEVELPLVPGERSERRVADSLFCLVEKESDAVSFYTSAKDARKALGRTSLGGWTDWMFAGILAQKGTVKVAFRAKLLRLDRRPARLHLYLSQGYPTSGFTHPADLAPELVKAAGPYQHHGHTQEWVFYGACDLTTMVEELTDHARWFREAACYTLANRDWDILVLKWHDTDTFQHCAFQMIDPIHPLYEREKEEEGWDLFRHVYGLGDQLVDAVLDVTPRDCVVAVVSDHGQLANTYFPNTRDAFVEAGLLALHDDGSIDLSRTKAVMTTTGVHVNLKGRYPGGIVSEGAEFKQVRRTVLSVLRDFRHPHTGDHAFSFVAGKENCAFMGLDGEQIGDVVYAVAPIVPDRKYSEKEYEELVIAGMWLTSRGTHGNQLPSERFGIGGSEGICVLAGPGVRAGARPRPTPTSTVAPTLSALAGISVPRDADASWIPGVLA
ncbi:MAG: alkaline phosphatase family protein [Planctomycetota bacterium]